MGRLPISALKAAFLLLHAVNAGVLLHYLHKHRPSRQDALLWGGLFAVLAFAGAYLEFPADAWDHFDRIFYWDRCEFVTDHIAHQRFAYFWMWTFLGDLPLEARRMGLDLCSAFWQWLVCLQFFLLLRRLGFEREKTLFLVLASLVFLGTSAFSFRYYGLSSTLLAYALYLRVLVCILDAWENKPRRLWEVPFLLAAIFANHFQELAFAVVATAAVGAARLPVRWLAIGFAISMVTLLIPDCARAWVSLWKLPSRQWDTLALPGILGLGYALVKWKRHPVFSALTLFPTVVLLLPPVAWWAATYLHPVDDAYRLLYTFPTCFAFALLILEKVRKIPLAAILLVLLSLLPFKGWRGRGYFQFYQVPAPLALDWQPQVARWFRVNRPPVWHCIFASDHVAGYSLKSSVPYTFYFREGRPPRMQWESVLHTIRTPQELLDFIDRERICGILVLDPKKSRERHFPNSSIGKLSGHWAKEHVARALQLPDAFYSSAEALAERGWLKAPVPPFFVFYGPPGP